MKHLLLLLSLLLNVSVNAQTPSQAAIATAHPLATQAGKTILQSGGNAFDAAIAITATLAVVEPYSSGLGGGGFWLLREQKQHKTVMIDGREMAPAKAHRDMYLDQDGQYIAKSSVDGALAAGIPGTVAAMVHLAEKYGNLPLQQVLQPAIKQAQKGFPVTEHYQKMARFRLSVLQKYKTSADIFLQNNDVPELGYLIVQKELAQTLKLIAQHGNAGFYKGHIANKLVDSVKENKGIWQLSDLKNYTIKEREPVQFHYRDMKITSVPPPSSGGVALATILQILQNYDLQSLDEVSQTHLAVEAMRRAYRDRAEFLGDNDFANVPVERLTHIRYADGLKAGIRLDKAMPSSDLPGIRSATKKKNAILKHSSEGQDTTHFSVLDTLGNMVSATMSINYPFGSGFTAKGTGVLLNDEMDDFSARPGTPNVYGLVGAEANAIAPGKRPLSSMSPTLVETNKGMALLGTPGGSRIITMVLLAILELEKNASVQQWVTRPRFHHQYLPDKIFYEKNALSKEQVSQLEQMGHQTRVLDSDYGNMQVISWDYKMGVQAASDPRVEGQAVVFEIPRKK
ncbi:MAG: gamma-glutamyltransferase [gamma proteobacterium symbiont of Bathyaustriella thionipta]|nr:gamma-glutamyltransferase [gamma proteobacterium symbiont of Bathyaustriella thionipta]MCU7949508.1 gamma-glutamyltransferase [gamma proteobacterium symbiont of Bathyaustriella thionipta]MCU7953227.1 gamma-glutamyltransferase [gamma proteobacterium symbiont of Bathyaustriella thionipta]MCU7956094.1 gamma-glutamyltransferase [gamma proteobacterium symbiont of Bathyaustriella thionipta]MCU7967783.1 gamma-glutamyltransferase [gamma proteobacterium symbiont of Bathyaustriella thionipta]